MEEASYQQKENEQAKDTQNQQQQQQQEDPWAFDQIVLMLKSKNIEYSLLDHKPCLTSEESANVRGVKLESGAKAMLVKDIKAEIFILLVMSASRKLSWKLAKQVLNIKKVDLAKQEEVLKVTRCLTGAVPPFGSIFNVKTYLDNSLISQGDTINFNCGLRTRSMNMKTQDYLKAENPTVCNFTE